MDPTTSQHPHPSPDPGGSGGDGDRVSPESVDRGYEPMLLRGRAIGWFVFWFVAVAVVIHAGLWLLVKQYDRDSRQAERPTSIIADGGAVPPGEQGPPLQPSTPHDALPREDLAAMHQAEDEVFAHLGWVDQTTHTIRVPDAVVSAVAKRTGGASTRPTTAQTARAEREDQ
jgi:hypothetical protein